MTLCIRILEREYINHGPSDSSKRYLGIRILEINKFSWKMMLCLALLPF